MRDYEIGDKVKLPKELEETKEEKEFKKVRTHLFDMGIQLTDEKIKILIKLIKGDNYV